MTNRGIAILLAFAVFLAYQPMATAAARQTTGEISGTALVEGKPLPNITVRLRNVDTGQLIGNMQTNTRGEFQFTGLSVGNFIVETVAPDGTVLGTSAKISLIPGAMVASGVTVSTSAAALTAAGVGAGAAGVGGAGGAIGAGAAAAGGGFFTTTAGLIFVVAAAAGVAAGVVAAAGTASPVR